jgi:Grx4 family monothiol glutaredoxin
MNDYLRLGCHYTGFSCGGMEDFESVADFIHGKDHSNRRFSLLYFCGEWAEPCRQLTPLLREILRDRRDQVRAVCVPVPEGEEPAPEAVEGLLEERKVTAIPTILVLSGNEELVRVEGFRPNVLRQELDRLSHLPSSSSSSTLEPSTLASPASPSQAPKSLSLMERLDTLVSQKPLMLFIKGNPSSPQCGFTRQLLEVLRSHQVLADPGQWATFDILGNPEVRAGLKERAQWPTYPQVYVKGEFVGGLDIVRELLAEGQFPSLH